MENNINNKLSIIIHELKLILDEIHGVKSEKEWSIMLFYLIQRVYIHNDFLDDGRKVEKKFYNVTDLIKTKYQKVHKPHYYWYVWELNNLRLHLKKGKWFLFVLTYKYLIFRISHFRRRKQMRLDLQTNSSQTKEVLYLISVFPVIYLEDFQFYFNWMYPDDKPINPYRLKNSFSIIYMKRISENLKINFLQHGGFYGEITGSPIHEMEYYLCDQFHTWGWQYKLKHLPYKANRLRDFRSSYSKFKDLNNLESISGRILFLPPPMISDYLYLYEEMVMLKNIENKYNLIFKPYGRGLTFDIKTEDRINSILKGIKAEIVGNEKRLNEFVKAGLVIVGYFPSTAFFEFLVINKPVLVVFAERDDYHPEYKYYINYFFEKKVFHKSIKELIDFLNNLNDVETWWQNISEEPEFNEFLNSYCRLELEPEKFNN